MDCLFPGLFVCFIFCLFVDEVFGRWLDVCLCFVWLFFCIVNNKIENITNDEKVKLIINISHYVTKIETYAADRRLLLRWRLLSYVKLYLISNVFQVFNLLQETRIGPIKNRVPLSVVQWYIDRALYEVHDDNFRRDKGMHGRMWPVSKHLRDR